MNSACASLPVAATVNSPGWAADRLDWTGGRPSVARFAATTQHQQGYS
jgi:hypothetical protein